MMIWMRFPVSIVLRTLIDPNRGGLMLLEQQGHADLSRLVKNVT
jgi:hypothetical protein